jgi:hypothetical protein
MKTYLAIFILLLLTIISCSKHEGNSAKKDSTSVEELKEGNLSQKPTEELIMKLLYGGYDKEQTEWNPKGKNLDPEIAKFSEGDNLFTSPILNETKKINGNDIIIFVTSSNLDGNDCHACAPFIGAFIFSNSSAGWQCEVKNYYIGEIGSYGEPPDVKIIDIGSSSIGLIFEGEDMNQGYNVKYVLIYTLFNNKFSESINLTTHSDNSGSDEEQWENNTTYKFVKGNNQEYDDLIIETTGKQYDDKLDKITSANKTVRYIFSNGKFRRTEAS